jgi:hypothetical protein
MRKLAVNHIIMALVVSALAATALGQEVVLGVLEDSRGWYAGEPNFRAVRVVFRKVGLDWTPFPSDCADQRCLKTVAAHYPHEMKWTITFDGKNLGQITSHTPSEFKWYAAVGQQEIGGTGHVPTVGKQSPEFGGYTEAVVYRPLVANSQPFFKDPDQWKRATPSQEVIGALQQEFRKQFPKLCQLDPHRDDEHIPTENLSLDYRNEDVKLVKAYQSNAGWVVARMHLKAVACDDVEAGFDIDDPWFAIDPEKSSRYLGSGMWLVDAGDYDNDGKSELVFSIDRDNRGGYELFYDDFKKRAIFEFGYH